MRKSVREFVGVVAETLSIYEPIVEFGAFQVSGQEDIADLRSLFPDKEYIGTDMREGLGVDRILNLHDIELPSGSVGTVLIMDTLEHVEFPHRALQEVHRVLQPNGIAVISSVMNFPIHDYPYDYWRFTPDGFRSLLGPFSDSFVGFLGATDFPHTIVGIGFRGVSVPTDWLLTEYERWKQDQESLGAWKRPLQLLIPPILFLIYRSVRQTLARRQ